MRKRWEPSASEEMIQTTSIPLLNQCVRGVPEFFRSLNLTDLKDIWQGDDEPSRPKNWSLPQKWTVTFILSGFAFIQPLAETMLAPVQKQITEDLSITEMYQWVLVNSLILIGVGFGPLLLAPISEIYGRRTALLGGGAIFIIWNTGCGFAQSLGQMLAFRLLAGFGACVADAVAGGVIADLWLPHQRGRAFAVYMAAPLLGPGLGPIMGAFISTGTTWRWVFWTTSIASLAVFVIAVLFLKETYEPRLEQLKRMQRARRGSIDLVSSAVFQQMAAEAPELWQLLRTNLQRPFRMLATQLIIQLIAIYMALLYGTMFLFLYIYPIMWTEQYGQSIRIGSLNYISAALGYIAGVQGKSDTTHLMIETDRAIRSRWSSQRQHILPPQNSLWHQYRPTRIPCSGDASWHSAAPSGTSLVGVVWTEASPLDHAKHW